MTELLALMLDDDGYRHGVYQELSEFAGISITVVPSSDAAFDALERVQLLKQPLDVFITDHSHPGIPGPQVIRRIRDLPDHATMYGGLRIRHIPIIVHSASQDPNEIATIDPSIICVAKPSKFEELARAVDRSVRTYHEKILNDLHYAGLGIQWTGGQLALVRCYTVPLKKSFETTYIDGTASTGLRSALQGYQRLVLVLDRDWSSERAIAELDALLNHPKTNERDLQAFFRLHPDFLYRNQSVDHWVEPRLRDSQTGRLFKPDFLLRSLCLPDRPWSWQIVDLKGPNVPLVTDHKFHAKLSHHVHKVVAQLREYSEFFDAPRNRDYAATAFGGQIRRPQLVAIIGRLPKAAILSEYARLKSQILDVSLVTYDEILEFRKCQTRWRRTLGGST